MSSRELAAQIAAVARAWPELRGEPNLQDLHWLASVLTDRMALVLPDDFPTRDRGVELVELVERLILLASPQHAVRLNPPEALVLHCEGLVQEISGRRLLQQYGDATNLAAALLTWVGCIRMAKSLRQHDSLGRAYTDEIRHREYARLRGLWSETGGNWIRFGTTLARALETGRGNAVAEEWVPRDSPYWTAIHEL